MLNIALIRFCAFCFGFIGGLITAMGTSTHHWSRMSTTRNGTEVIYHRGLWYECEQIEYDLRCYRIPQIDWLNAVKAFLIIAIVLYLLVILYLIIMVWGRGMTIRMIGIDLLFAAMFSLIAMAVYTGKYKMKAGYEYGWSYALGWAGTVCSVIAGILCFFSDVDYEPMR